MSRYLTNLDDFTHIYTHNLKQGGGVGWRKRVNEKDKDWVS